MGILIELNGYAVADEGRPHLVIRGDNAAEGASPDLAIGYAIGVLHQRNPGKESHEVRYRDYPDNRIIAVRVFRSEEFRGEGWISQ